MFILINLFQLYQEHQELKKTSFVEQDRLWKDIELLKKRQEENTKKENFEETLENIRLELMRTKEEVIKLQNEKKVYQNCLLQKTNQIEDLKIANQNAMQEMETIPALRMQVSFNLYF